VCCLIGQVIDEVPYGEGTKVCSDTDLTKNIMNSFDIKRRAFEGSAAVLSKADEFNTYIDTWGIAKTVLRFPYVEQARKIIARIGDSTVGVVGLGSDQGNSLK
jgi:hypothetical protein